MTETVPELIARRMGELQITSLLALHRRLPEGSISYETVRNLANGKQRGTRDERVIRDLATMLSVKEDVVRAALGAEPNYGPWELPERAQGLDQHERQVVVSMVDALLRAKRTGGSSDGRQPEAEKSDDGGSGAAHDVGKAGAAFTPSGGQPDNVRHITAKQQKMMDDSLMVDQAACDGDEPDEGEEEK
ncbi:hypothetical protein [Tessaracoccus palaemonis]|uniref:Immunity repressor n=1 Tax=Tessaracoccus palaemonis TaxID=2829499 RepID=A0ABX8SHF3_9ACTN|nr:hypothetical protein [Tessaracoccus palaemonis]QXT62720.1 hypothetical protein KDB89_13455 [Tessaracoccus palaemonis]